MQISVKFREHVEGYMLETIVFNLLMILLAPVFSHIHIILCRFVIGVISIISIKASLSCSFDNSLLSKTADVSCSFIVELETLSRGDIVCGKQIYLLFKLIAQH